MPLKSSQYAMPAVALLEDTRSQAYTIYKHGCCVCNFADPAQLQMLLILVMVASGRRNLDKGTEGQVPRRDREGFFSKPL